MKDKKFIGYLATISLSLVVIFSMPVSAAEKPADFDMLIALTPQNPEMDWWFAVPSQFSPNISKIDSVSKGEHFMILPIFNNYGTEKDQSINIIYDIEIIKPDGSKGEHKTDCVGYHGKTTGPYVLPAKEIPVVWFEPEDPVGEYAINVIAYDHIKNQKSKKTEKIKLKNFSLPEVREDKPDEWFLAYPTHPKPSEAMAYFLKTPRPYIDEKGQPLWSALWFFKCVFEDNEYLIPHMVTFFKEAATIQQKKDIILLFYLLKKVDMLPLTGELSEYSKTLKGGHIPDPYSEITDAGQLDMLWGEFFATSRVRPVRRIITAFNLSKYSGTLEKVKAGKLDPKSKQVEEDAMKEAVFQSALWSMRSNCERVPLLFQYCVGLYDSQKLNENEKIYLGTILKMVSEDKKTEK